MMENIVLDRSINFMNKMIGLNNELAHKKKGAKTPSQLSIINSQFSIKTLIAATLIFLSISLQAFADRSIQVTSSLNHQSGNIGTYRALIIGIQNYIDPKIPDLETPLKDAAVMAGILEFKYGFKVDVLLDGEATRKALYNALRDISARAKPEDSVLIYYAGHGDLDRQYQDGWWIPVDATGGDPVTYLDNIQVQKAMRAMVAKHVLLISDSCYAGTLFGQARAMPQVINERYYLNLYNEKSRWGMTSGNKTPVSDSGTQGYSVFAYQLIKKLMNNDQPYLSTQEIYTHIAPIIGNNSEQTPLCRPIKNTGDQGGEFVFIARKTPGVGIPAAEAEPIASVLPANTGTSFDDIVTESKKKQEQEAWWKLWQADREGEYVQITRLDKDLYLTGSQKQEAWSRFLSAVSQDNPFTTRDDDMRQLADAKVFYWKQLEPVPVVPVIAAPPKVNDSTIKTALKPGDLWQDPVAGMVFVWVPGGCFWMGSVSGEADEKPVHKVCVDGFWMGKYEVTQGQWKKIMGRNPSKFKSGDIFPVETVSWDDAKKYISKLSQQSGNDFSLPTEAQWEYAATSGGKDQTYAGGDIVDQVAWYQSNSKKKTHQVGIKASNGLGIYDMSGNVWEWCLDNYDKNAYSKHSHNNPLITSGNNLRLFRGGSWANKPVGVRAANRIRGTADYRDFRVGFRLCLSRINK